MGAVSCQQPRKLCLNCCGSRGGWAPQQCVSIRRRHHLPSTGTTACNTSGTVATRRVPSSSTTTLASATVRQVLVLCAIPSSRHHHRRPRHHTCSTTPCRQLHSRSPILPPQHVSMPSTGATPPHYRDTSPERHHRCPPLRSTTDIIIATLCVCASSLRCGTATQHDRHTGSTAATIAPPQVRRHSYQCVIVQPSTEAAGAIICRCPVPIMCRGPPQCAVAQPSS